MSNTDEPQSAEQPKPKPTDQESITLDTPVHHGSKTIDTIIVRKPTAGTLRGLSLTDVLQMDVAALTKLLPRISVPPLDEATVREMDPADLVQIGGAVANFLLPKSMRETD